MVLATYSATAISVARNELVVLINTPSTSKKSVSKKGGNWRPGCFHGTEVCIRRPFIILYQHVSPRPYRPPPTHRPDPTPRAEHPAAPAAAAVHGRALPALQPCAPVSHFVQHRLLPKY